MDKEQLKNNISTYINLCEDESLNEMSDINVIEHYRYKIIQKINEMYDEKEKKTKHIVEYGIEDNNMPF